MAIERAELTLNKGNSEPIYLIDDVEIMQRYLKK
jgi:hypothetical protein